MRNKTIPFLIIIILVLVLIAVISIRFGNNDTPSASDPDNGSAPQESTVPATPTPTPPPEFVAAPEGYFKDALLIGDSAPSAFRWSASLTTPHFSLPSA